MNLILRSILKLYKLQLKTSIFLRHCVELIVLQHQITFNFLTLSLPIFQLFSQLQIDINLLCQHLLHIKFICHFSLWSQSTRICSLSTLQVFNDRSQFLVFCLQDFILLVQIYSQLLLLQMQLFYSALQHSHSSAKSFTSGKLVSLSLSLTYRTVSLFTHFFLFASSQFNDSYLLWAYNRSGSIKRFGRGNFSHFWLISSEIKKMSLQNSLTWLWLWLDMVRFDKWSGTGQHEWYRSIFF